MYNIHTKYVCVQQNKWTTSFLIRLDFILALDIEQYLSIISSTEDINVYFSSGIALRYMFLPKSGTCLHHSFQNYYISILILIRVLILNLISNNEYYYYSIDITKAQNEVWTRYLQAYRYREATFVD